MTVDEYLVATPILEWIFPDSITSVSTSPQSTNGIVFNITLIFDEVRTSQGGIYGCRVAINITGFDLLSQTINETVRVQSSYIHVPCNLVTLYSFNLQFHLHWLQSSILQLFPTMEQFSH